jgi:hypothetical protein
MAMYAMVVSNNVRHTGFFTPLYHIASAFISPNAMMTSMTQSMHGNSGYFDLGPAVVGAMVHMMTGAMAGAIFAVVIARLHTSRVVVIAAGAGFGLVVLLANSLIALPIIAHVFGGGDPIAHMAKIVGWAHFTIEHVLFGLALGLFVSEKFSSPHKSISRG